MNELKLTKTEQRILAGRDAHKRMETAVDLRTGLLRTWMRKNMKCGTKACPGGCGKKISRQAAACLACAGSAALGSRSPTLVSDGGDG
jgi:hypothetical protein